MPADFCGVVCRSHRSRPPPQCILNSTVLAVYRALPYVSSSFPATAWAEAVGRPVPLPPDTQFNGRPFPATVSAEGAQLNGRPSLPGRLEKRNGDVVREL